MYAEETAIEETRAKEGSEVMAAPVDSTLMYNTPLVPPFLVDTSRSFDVLAASELPSRSPAAPTNLYDCTPDGEYAATSPIDELYSGPPETIIPPATAVEMPSSDCTVLDTTVTFDSTNPVDASSLQIQCSSQSNPLGSPQETYS